MPSSNVYRNWLRALGAPEDPVATDTTSEWSLVSLMKALYQKISDGSFAASVTGRAESLVALCQSAALQCAGYLKQTRTAKLAAAASATTAGAAATSASTDASTASAQAALAGASVSFSAGAALFGQRAKKDRVAAASSAAAAASSAGSVPATETLPLPMQIFS